MIKKELINNGDKIKYSLDFLKSISLVIFLFSLLYYFWTIWWGLQPTLKLANQTLENSNKIMNEVAVTNRQFQEAFPDMMETNENVQVLLEGIIDTNYQFQKSFPDMMETNREIQVLLNGFAGTNYQVKKGLESGNRILHKVEYPIEGLSSFNPF